MVPMQPTQPPVTPVAWTLLIPLKPLSRAKSRLSGAADGTPLPRLALAFAQDTVQAALACEPVRNVVVVTDDPQAGRALAALGARIVPDEPADGLNAALSHGADAVRSADSGAALAALNADLPALRPEELHRVLNAASRYSRAFLPDAAEIGTTFLSAVPGAALEPAFGGRSRARHRASGAREIAARGVESVRQDVDTPADLRAALTLGVGEFTSALLAGRAVC